MTVIRGKFVVVAVLVFMGLTLCAGNSLAEDNILNVQGTCPDILSGAAFNISLKITNNTDHTIYFDRVALMYVNPDMSFSGPVESSISAKYVTPGATVKRDVSFTVETTQPSGTIIPIMINLFNGSLSTDNNSLRGTVVVGAKLQ